VRSHPVVESLALAGATTVLAFLGAVLASGTGAGEIGAALAVAVVVALVFAWRPTDGLIAFGLVVLFADTIELRTGVGLRFADEAAIPLLVLAALVAHRDRLTRPSLGWGDGALGVLLGAGTISSMVNAVPASIWIIGLGLLAKGFVFFYLVLALQVRLEDLRRVTGTFLVIGVVIIGIGLLQFLLPDLAATLGVPSGTQQRGSLAVVSSVFTHPALYGWLAAFLALFLYARFSVHGEWWALLLAIGMGAASVLSGRRTPIVGLLAGVLVGIARQFTHGQGRVRALLTAVVLFGVLAAISLPLLGDFYRHTLTQYVEPPELIAEVLSESPDAAVIAPMAPRNALYVGSVAIARDHLPLGAGLGRFGSHMSRESYSPVYQAYGLELVSGLQEADPVAVTDTFWPMVLGETGVIGLGAALTFFAVLGARLWQSAANGPVAMRAFLLGALLVYVESLVRSLTSPLFVAPPVAYFVFGAAALAVAARRDVVEDASALAGEMTISAAARPA
jgi:hypothetical protein